MPTLFKSALLRQADEQAQPVINDHLAELNDLTHDITVLEERLGRAGIPFRFIYILCSDQRTVPKSYDGMRVNDYRVLEDSCLVFERSESSNARLNYCEYTREARLYQKNGREELGSFTEPGVSFSRPFIETKVSCRREHAEELPFFYDLLIAALKERRPRDTVLEYSPRYHERSMFYSPKRAGCDPLFCGLEDQSDV